MKKSVLVFLNLLVFATLFAGVQTVTLSQPFDLSHIHSQDTLSVTVTTNASTSLYFKTVYDKDSSEIFLTQQSFYSYIEQVSGQIPRIYALAYILKSDRFVNNFLGFLNQNGQFDSVSYSVPMFALGNDQQQCGNYAEFAVNVLVQTQTFSSDSIWHVSLAGHQLAECLVNGDTLLLDFDPDEPIFLNRDSMGNYLTAFEIAAMQNPSAAGPIYIYRDPVSGDSAWLTSAGGDGNPPNDSVQTLMLDTNYVNYFKYGVDYFPQVLPSLDPDTGMVRLPAHSSMRFSMQMGEVLTQAQADAFIQQLRSDTVPVPNIFAFLDSVLGITDSALQIMFKQTNFIIQGISLNKLSLTDMFERWNMVDVWVATQEDTVFIGRDLKMPFWVHQVTATKPVVMRDTIFPAGTSTMWLWNEKGAVIPDGFDPNDDTTDPAPSRGQVEKLESGGFIPPHDSVHFVLYYNQRMFPFILGLNADILAGDTNSFSVIQYQTLHLDTVTNLIDVQVSKLSTLKVYPNPTHGTFIIESEGAHQGTLAKIYDSNGDSVITVPITQSKQTISLENYPAGVYYVNVGNQFAGVIKISK